MVGDHAVAGGIRRPVAQPGSRRFQIVLRLVTATASAQPPTLQRSSMKGTVKRFYFRKGFGFIEGDQGTEYFFHYTDFTGDKEALRPGLEVEFEAQQGDKGPCAVAVVQPGGKPAAARPRSTNRAPAAGAPRRAARPYLPFAAGLVLGIILGAVGHIWLSGL
ncbi:cold shock domain-containing protein [Immundisolibacter sp.]|uniref:cold shock domain-containing protein n=1 Tax=Immundisolibacter sp. TaxID=1934948 RepID=UPI0025C01448|nr:cold shock domain-containing protein [Immundisolibacter sp.]